MSRVCVVCGVSIAHKRSDARYCSETCHRNGTLEASRAKVRRWRLRNPEKQRAASDRWAENNPERHRELKRRASENWRNRHPDKKAEDGRRYRAKLMAALNLYREIETKGLEALL